ncbi:tRNA dihydrouridine(16) synthase DusC [Orbaceae bacterium ac157xtp]
MKNAHTALFANMTNKIKRIILAPMEGVLDYNVRQYLTAINPFAYCVTEFLRVTHHKLSKKTFYRNCPELNHEGKTQSGTPVRIQLLGQSPELVAENAVLAVELGSYGIDINCGCPAKSVVGSQGGAYLLKSPELIYQITKAVKNSLDAKTCVSVKVRLGWDDKSHCFEIADAVAQGGADEIVVHGRTKADGYQADKIDWQSIGKIRQRLTIPVIANGEIFTVEDAENCLTQSGTDSIMLARGILNTPNLADMIYNQNEKLAWQQTFAMLQNYANSTSLTDLQIAKPYYHSARIKQWLSYLKQTYPQASELLAYIRTLKTQSEIITAFKQFNQ